MGRAPEAEVKTSPPRCSSLVVPFVKMHGLGNDYVYLDEREVEVPPPGPWSVILSDRHRGVGADGLIVLRRDERAAVRMEMVNADGTPSGMCGNGLRCVARLARERGYATEDHFLIAVDGGLRPTRIVREAGRPGGAIVGVSIDLGVPRFGPERRRGSPADGAPPLERITLAGGGPELLGLSVDVGNPHFVHRVAEGTLADHPLGELGPRVERHPRFPDRTNFGVVEHRGGSRLGLRVWERGAGETQACGSGATAAAAAMRALGIVGDEVTVEVLGGVLRIEFDDAGHAWMTGPAEESFRGVFPLALVEPDRPAALS